MATHSPILMALPNASLLEITRHGILETSLLQTRHFQLYRSFATDPDDFVARALEDDDDLLA
jgi:predicted ATPase